MKPHQSTKQSQNGKKVTTFLKPSTNPIPIYYTPSPFFHPNVHSTHPYNLHTNLQINENNNRYAYNTTNVSQANNTNASTNTNANNDNGNGNGNGCGAFGVGLAYAGKDGKMVGDWDGQPGEKCGSTSNFNSYRVSIAGCKNGKYLYSTQKKDRYQSLEDKEKLYKNGRHKDLRKSCTSQNSLKKIRSYNNSCEKQKLREKQNDHKKHQKHFSITPNNIHYLNSTLTPKNPLQKCQSQPQFRQNRPAPCSTPPFSPFPSSSLAFPSNQHNHPHLHPHPHVHLHHGPLSRSTFKFMYQIGFGGFGKVWKVQEKTTWIYYAMKQINKRKYDIFYFRVIEKDSVECICNQRKILGELGRFRDLREYGDNGGNGDNEGNYSGSGNGGFLVYLKYSFQDKDNLYMIMDYLKGADLRYHICYRQNFNQAQTKFIIACLILAVQQIHSRGIVHRDIKPQNLVLQQSGYVRLTDFGIAKVLSPGSSMGSVDNVRLSCGSTGTGNGNGNGNGVKYDSSGTPGYMAPEILLKQEYNHVSDYFAIGVIGYQLMLGKRPYTGKNRKQIKQHILQSQAQILSDDLPHSWSQDSRHFLNSLLQNSPTNRLGSNTGIHQLKNHPWMKQINWRRLARKQLLPPFIPNIVCETKEYLEEIQSYNQMNQSRERGRVEEEELSQEEQRLFQGYQSWELPKHANQPKCVGYHAMTTSGSPIATPFRNLRNTIQKSVSKQKSKQKQKQKQRDKDNKQRTSKNISQTSMNSSSNLNSNMNMNMNLHAQTNTNINSNTNPNTNPNKHKQKQKQKYKKLVKLY